MVSGSVIEFCFIVLLCVSMRSNYVATLPSTFLQDEQQQAEQQAESISERFFDEVRQLLEQKVLSEAAAADLETTTTEPPPVINADERFIDTTIPAAADHVPKENLPTVRPPKPTQVRPILNSVDLENSHYFHTSNAFICVHFFFIRHKGR